VGRLRVVPPVAAQRDRRVLEQDEEGDPGDCKRQKASPFGDAFLRQTAPFFPIITGTVRAMILRSSVAERRRMYSRSRPTFRFTSSRH
jgi:hypothetical protein